jgi:hypothetical protein
VSLYHGTSAAAAFEIAKSGIIRPSKDGFFYAFDSSWPEAMAGALCFATGDGPRQGCVANNNLFMAYARLNPDFPKGLRGLFYKLALKKIGAVWAKSQMQATTSELGRLPAILVFEDNRDAQERIRQGFVREKRIPAHALTALKLTHLYLDTAAFMPLGLTDEFVVLPITACVDQLTRQLSELK